MAVGGIWIDLLQLRRPLEQPLHNGSMLKSLLKSIRPLTVVLCYQRILLQQFVQRRVEHGFIESSHPKRLQSGPKKGGGVAEDFFVPLLAPVLVYLTVGASRAKHGESTVFKHLLSSSKLIEEGVV